ncbi:MAG TPA: MlaD family protein, partial [Magnetospirillaceae bacterium]|nr:MlaD family protein [Magnetospirillaceae bacterium]
IAGLVAVHINSSREKAEGYPLVARFDKAEGVALGTEVRLAGVTVGKVTDQKLDDNFRAVLTLRLADSVKLPADSNATVQTDSLLGAKFISLQPGGDDKNLQPGEEIAYTQGSLSLQDLLAMIISQGENAHGEKKE